MWSTDTSLQPQQVVSTTVASGRSTVDQQMRTMLSSFLGQKQETTTTIAFCNYLALEVEGLEEKDSQTFSNEAVKFLSHIQSRAEERDNQPQQPTDTFMKLQCNFNICATDISTATAASTTCKGIHFNYPTNTDAFRPGHATHSVAMKGQQQLSRGQQLSLMINRLDLQDRLCSLQPSISCLCYRQRKSTQYIRTFMLQKSSGCDELPTD